ncbi:MAG: hypothetical protein FJ249_05575 [Nitrospira sp.]|nr:hypothetical protein [Nitrospira sp.]
MKPALYAGLLLGLVPVQAALLQHIEFVGIRPDLCLVAACLAGFLAGELEGLLIGLALGLVQGLFSAGDLWLNVITKGGAGLLAGLAGRHVTNPTTVSMLAVLAGLSVLSGIIVLVAIRSGAGLVAFLAAVRSVLVPEVVLNAAVGTGLYWLIARRVRRQEAIPRGPAGLIG